MKVLMLQTLAGVGQVWKKGTEADLQLSPDEVERMTKAGIIQLIATEPQSPEVAAKPAAPVRTRRRRAPDIMSEGNA